MADNSTKADQNQTAEELAIPAVARLLELARLLGRQAARDVLATPGSPTDGGNNGQE